MKYKGAQPEQYIVKPTVEQFKKYQEAANGLIKYITMAADPLETFDRKRRTFLLYSYFNGLLSSGSSPADHAVL